jgi:hypothetical protein
MVQGRALAGWVRRQRAFDNQATNSCWTDGQFLSRLVKRDLATLGAFAFSIDGDVVIAAQRCDSRTRPRMPLGRRLPSPIES